MRDPREIAAQIVFYADHAQGVHCEMFNGSITADMVLAMARALVSDAAPPLPEEEPAAGDHDWQSDGAWFKCRRCGSPAPSPHAGSPVTSCPAAPAPGEQCPAVLPNDRRLQFNDGWLCCALRAGHSAPHRTVYNEPSRCEGDPAWTFDVAAIKALPSPYRDPVSRAAAPAPGVVLSEEQRRAIGIARDHMLGDVTDLAEPERWAGILDRLLSRPSPRPATLTVGAALMLPEVRSGALVEYREWCPPDIDDDGRVVEPSGFTGTEYQVRWRRDVDGYAYTEIRRRMRNGRWWTWQENHVPASDLDAPCTLIPSSETP